MGSGVARANLVKQMIQLWQRQKQFGSHKNISYTFCETNNVALSVYFDLIECNQRTQSEIYSPESEIVCLFTNISQVSQKFSLGVWNTNHGSTISTITFQEQT